MADIWDRVDEAIDTDPLKLRGIVAELLARAEHAEKAAAVNRERGDQWRRERDVARKELADMEGVVADIGVVRLKLQATIERVRALRGRSSMGRVNDYVPLADVRAALDGGK